MKNLYLILALVILSTSTVAAQDFSYKPGKVTQYEIKMDSYPADTSAAAVILYENTEVKYVIVADDSRSIVTQYRDYFIKAKILRQDGTGIADFELPFFSTFENKETITGLSASAYNLEGSKIVETSLKKQYIFTEEMSPNHFVMKFSIPNVKAGSVIEVKYTVQSTMIDIINPIVFQHEYPVILRNAKVAIPQYFKFNVNAQGVFPINVDRKTGSGSYNYMGHTETYDEDITLCKVENIPALKDEAQVWCPEDFRTTIYFELSKYEFPGSYYKTISATWAAVNELLDRSAFGGNAKASNPFKKEVAAICAATNDEGARIAAIHRLVMSNIAWNNIYRITSAAGVGAAANKGSGSSADINFALNAAMKDAGFKTDLILLNPRQFGRLPASRPTVDNINSFIVRVTMSNGAQVYLDGTSKSSAPNVLPLQLMVDRARVYGDNSTGGWIDLTRISASLKSTMVNAKLSADGTISGKLSNNYSGSIGMRTKQSYATAGNDEKYVEGLEEQNNMEISEFSIEEPSVGDVAEKYDFTLHANSTGDHIYLNATLIPFMSKNPLTQQERKLPVEFSAPDSYTINCLIEIPEGYTIEDMPKPSRMSVCENGVSMQYVARLNGQILQIQLQYSMNRIVYSAQQYTDLRTFFGMVSTLSSSNIILKKL